VSDAFIARKIRTAENESVRISLDDGLKPFGMGQSADENE
jgi:hypothetical protein